MKVSKSFSFDIFAKLASSTGKILFFIFQVKDCVAIWIVAFQNQVYISRLESLQVQGNK